MSLHVCVCICTYTPVRQSEPEAGMGLWPWGFICPCDSNWGDWDSGTTTEQND